MKLNLCLLLFFVHFITTATGQSVDSLNSPVHTIPAFRERILIINSFDAKAINARKNKKELFRALADSLVLYLFEKLKEDPVYEPVVVPTILYSSSDHDSLVFSCMTEKKAGRAIVILSLEAYFNESGSKEETDEDGKPVTITSYDLCAKNEYALFGPDSILKRSTLENCEFFTTRSVRGSFSIRFGPDIVGKKKHTYKVVANNASACIHDILKGSGTHQ